MNINLLQAKDLAKGDRSWTLTTRIGEMLELATSMFGEINSDKVFLGIEFKDDGPRIQYQEPNYIVIQLTPNVLDDEYLAYYQLSHEVYHLLSSTGNFDSNNLGPRIVSFCVSQCVLQRDFAIQPPNNSKLTSAPNNIIQSSNASYKIKTTN